MIDLLSPYRWLLAIALIASVWVGLVEIKNHYIELGDHNASVRYEAAISRQKAAAEALLAAETAKVREREQSLQKFTDDQNRKDADHEKTLAALSVRLRVLAGPSGRLRDPEGVGQGGGGPGGQTASPAADRGADTAQDAGLLSRPISELLLSITSEADTINDAYISCRADAEQLRK